MTVEVAALTSGKHVPTARFRIRQHIDPLLQYGVRVQEFSPFVSKYGLFGFDPKGWARLLSMPVYAAWQGVKLISRIPGILGSWRNQVTWLERELLTGIYSLEGLLKKPLVLDVDDAIWLTFPFSVDMVRKIASQAEIIVVGNSYLADWFSKFGRDIRIIPTAIDVTRFRPRKDNHQDTRFIVGWTGGSWNLPYLYFIEKPLANFLKRHPDAHLRVICNQAPKFSLLPPEKTEYIPWSTSSESRALNGVKVGLMPLPENDWARGKCSYKMLQHMASGQPVIVTPVGMNADILKLGEVGLPARNQDEWEEALEFLYDNPDMVYRWGMEGRQIVKCHYSMDAVTPELANVFMESVATRAVRLAAG